MKMLKKIMTSVCTAALLFTLMAGNVFATESVPMTSTTQPAYEYSYKVTLYTGNKGTFDDAEFVAVYREIDGNIEKVYVPVVQEADKIVISDLKYRDTVTMNVVKEADTEYEAVTLNDAKYYVSGIRLSGRDNAELELSSIEVTGDADYVTAYEIKGEQVKYTVRYVNEDGRSLAATETYYGNIGSKPVVAFKYIRGWNPKVSGFTKTLSADESENVFTFVYSKMPSDKEIEVEVENDGETTVVYIDGGTTVINGGGNGTGGRASNVTGGGNGTGNADDNDDAATVDGGNGINEDSEGTAGANGIVDLDDEETPLANIEVDGSEEASGSSTGIYLSLGILAIIIAGVIIYIVSKKRKTEE